MKPVVIPEEANAARLRIALEHIRRAPFRVVDVPLDVSCEFLHEVIQAAFGWQSYHLWTFEARDLRIELPDPEGDMLPYGPTVDASRYSVAQALDTAGGSLRVHLRLRGRLAASDSGSRRAARGRSERRSPGSCGASGRLRRKTAAVSPGSSDSGM